METQKHEIGKFHTAPPRPLRNCEIEDRFTLSFFSSPLTQGEEGVEWDEITYASGKLAEKGAYVKLHAYAQHANTEPRKPKTTPETTRLHKIDTDSNHIFMA